MDCTSQSIAFRQTNYFTPILLDYVEQSATLQSFFRFPPTLEGIKKSLLAREGFPTNRNLLAQELEKQYQDLPLDAAVISNIEALVEKSTFTVTTAHQPNIFTGPLYFIYKIIHAIKLADHLGKMIPGKKFVPVYYMGSEDADLDELGHTTVDGQRLNWNTKQKGAVGRMQVDQQLSMLINIIEAQLSPASSGPEITSLIRDCYKPGSPLQTATFRLVNALFGRFGLVVLIPDNAALKASMTAIFRDDLLKQQPSVIVENTSKKLATKYKVQANPRDINLFYLKDNIRERIEKREEKFEVLNTGIIFSPEELLKELEQFPDRFSPNVILRGLLQETVLPNIVFIGGGGELAYWLQLNELFQHYQVPYPVLLLRNSFLLVEHKIQLKLDRLAFNSADLFWSAEKLLTKLVSRETTNKIQLNGSLVAVDQLYESFKKQAGAIDKTLAPHVEALKKRSLQSLQELEKKMIRAEKRKFDDERRQIQAIKEKLFPGGSLQERVENFSYYYAKWGSSLIDELYSHSSPLDGGFVVLTEN